ncbi:unnamed protein product [Rhizopus stolonifer]
MGGGPFYNKNLDLINIPQEQKSHSMNSLYPTYNPEDFQIDPVPLVAPLLPPRPEAYRQERREYIARMIYTKSGFHSSGTHGFFTIFSKSMESIEILVSWIPEHLIDPIDISQFVELDGEVASDCDYPAFHLHIEEMTLLNDIYSIYMCPPTLEQSGSIEVTLKSGIVLGSVVYSSQAHWPGYDIIDILNTFAPIKSWNNYLYLVGEPPQNLITPDPSIYNTLATHNAPEIPSSIRQVREDLVAQRDALVNPLANTVKDAQWTILERLSRITQYSRDTASQVLDHPIAKMSLVAPHLQFLKNYANETLPDEQDRNFLGSDDLGKLLADAPELQGPEPIHTRRQPKISVEEWGHMFDHQGKLVVPVTQVKEMIFTRGLCQEIRADAWKFLLGAVPWQSTQDERQAILQSGEDAYYRIKATWFNDVEIQETEQFQMEKHRIDKDVHRTDRTQEAFESSDMPNPDPGMIMGTNSNLEILKDILVSYNFYNTELGYVQGMSDLLAPMFVIMDNEAQAFWAFTCFMDRMQSNFYIDQSGMLSQLKLLNDLIQFMDPALYKRFEETESTHLFFCFRWLLVWFKREFEWEDVIELWEVLWTDWLTDKMVLFIALAVLEIHRDKILNELGQFDEILRYINDLTGHIDLKSTLKKAEVLYYQFERKTKAMQHKSNKLKERLQERSVWNGPERLTLQADIEKLQIPKNLLTFIVPSKN